MVPEKLLFLPGASGNTNFWRPVADLLKSDAQQVHIGWPGFGPTAADPHVNGIEDLVSLVLKELEVPSAVIGQSMGGVVAIQCALRKPYLVTHLVLTATSGGMDLSKLGAVDWRESFHALNPTFPRWFADYHEDLTEKLETITIPTLLLWGDADPISPPLVGERLAALMPKSELHIVHGGTHDLANAMADQVAPLIRDHLNIHLPKK
ncbi:alpha/beta hydrolase [Geomonas sp.]|uniref:alpha/beta fold hydrolase n=1 Tax=Geomonas sp. TaxID=2651584 RepID=UPI002B4651D5|nr:alpha/beta hydrolase [Geomonas sp.]HJV34337.1 alpha/beta hydrolase [Geomonas sp.]